jgi:aspartyl/asparaginyl beta-hydroxylase (cupin superfamily)
MQQGSSYSTISYRILSALGRLFIMCIEGMLGFFSKEKAAVIDPATKPWTKQLEQHTHAILGELDTLLADYEAIPSLGDLSYEQQRIIAGKQQWKTFILYIYGAPVDKNISRCPATDRAIRGIPGMTMAFFSILEPHTALTPHRGPYKGVLRCHLGLIVPEPKESCGIRVDGRVYHWQVGESFIFDDTYMHEAWNNSGEKRVVLFIDFKRDYTFPINVLNNMMIWLIQKSPFIGNILTKIEEGTKPDLIQKAT